MPGGNKHFSFISYSCYSPFSWARAGSCPKRILLKHLGVSPTCGEQIASLVLCSELIVTQGGWDTSKNPCKTLLGALVLISPLKGGEEAKEGNLNLSSPSFKDDEEEALGGARAPHPFPPPPQQPSCCGCAAVKVWVNAQGNVTAVLQSKGSLLSPLGGRGCL